MTREEFRKVRHAFRAFLSRYEHGGALKPSFNDYRDLAAMPQHYYFMSRFTRCSTDPLLGLMREHKETLTKVRKAAAEVAAYHAERVARNAIARASYSPQFAAVLDQIDATFARRAA